MWAFLVPVVRLFVASAENDAVIQSASRTPDSTLENSKIKNQSVWNDLGEILKEGS